MDLIAEILITAMLVIGGIFGLVGSYGMLKLKEPMQRLHAPSKATTIGVSTALFSSMLYFTLLKDSLSWHELMISLFLIPTAPITALYIAKVHLHTVVPRDDLPATGGPQGWAIHDAIDDPEDAPKRPRAVATKPDPTSQA